VQVHILKISIVESSPSAETLRLEGHLSGPWVNELRSSCDQVLSNGKQLTLDLAAVSFTGRDGIRFLQGLKCREVIFKNCSPFVALQLEGDSVK